MKNKDKISDKETVLWALGKLAEELAFYINMDRIKAGSVGEGILREHGQVIRLHRDILDGKVMVCKPPKENKHA